MSTTIVKVQRSGREHTLKFAGENLCDAVLDGRKKHEIRKNDRDYRVGDIVIPIPCNKDGFPITHPISSQRYIITYVSAEWPVALKKGYCVFTMERLELCT